MEYKISKEAARLLAVGLYRQVCDFVTDAKQDATEYYVKFKAAYEARKLAQVSASTKCQHSRQRNTQTR